MSDVLVVLAVAVGSYALRTSFIVHSRPGRVSPTLVDVLEHVKPAALAALAATSLISHGSPSPTHIVALGVTVVASRVGVGLLGAMALGLLTLTVGNLIA